MSHEFEDIFQKMADCAMGKPWRSSFALLRRRRLALLTTAWYSCGELARVWKLKEDTARIYLEKLYRRGFIEKHKPHARRVLWRKKNLTSRCRCEE